MISIVIPLYNKESQIENTLRSVFNQTFQNYEIIVVNDGSTDNSVELVKAIHDPRIRLVEQTNQGVSAARNRGITEAKYEYVALLDADDEWKPTYLESQVDLINSFPECSVYACAYEFKRDGKTTPIILNKLPFKGEKGVLNNYFEVASCSHPPICSINIVAQKQAFMSIGGFPEGIKSGEDLLTWARLAVGNSIAYNTSAQAVFIIPIDLSHRSNRLYLDEKDYVNDELLALIDKSSSLKTTKDIKRYVGRWNEMTASSLLKSGRKEAFAYSLKAIKYKGLELKLLFFVLLSLMPKAIRMKVMNK